MDTTTLKFASSESRLYVFSAVVYLLTLNHLATDLTGLVFWLALAAWLLWIGIRSRGKPCAQLDDHHLVVFDQGRIKYCIALNQIAEVRKGLNSTILLLHDGLRVSVSHLNFMKKADVSEFRAALARRLPATAAA